MLSGRYKNSLLPSRFNPVRHWTNSLFYRADGASLAFFRICFGFIMLVECYRFYDHGWIEKYYIEPEFMFKYFGFEWVQALSGNGMYWLFGLLALLSLCIMLGLFYRLAIWLFFFSFTYVFLLEQARYLNHFYFVIILALVLAISPAHNQWSVDSMWLKKRKNDTVPWWSIFLFRANMEIVLIYAGVVKITADWLRLEPMGIWLAQRDNFALVLEFADTVLVQWHYGHLFNQDWVVALASYSAIAIHLICAPLLLIKRTRMAAVFVYCLFHLSNHFLFTIGIFPWMTIASTLIFLDPSWPRTSLHFIRHRAGTKTCVSLLCSSMLAVITGSLVHPNFDNGLSYFLTVLGAVLLTLGLAVLLAMEFRGKNRGTATAKARSGTNYV